MQAAPADRTPTSAARAFLPGARHALAGAQRATGAARAVAGMTHGELHLASLLSVTLGVLPSVLAAWHQHHPLVDVVLHEYADLDDFAAVMADATADVAIGPLPEAWTGPHHLPGRAARRWVLYDTAHGLATTVQHLCSQAVFARPAPHPLVSEFLDLARDSARLLPRHLTDLLGTRA